MVSAGIEARVLTMQEARLAHLTGIPTNCPCAVSWWNTHQRSTPQPALPASQKHRVPAPTQNRREEQEQHFILSSGPVAWCSEKEMALSFALPGVPHSGLLVYLAAVALTARLHA